MSPYIGSVPDLERPADWRESATCRETDAELFFASEQTAAGRADVEEAKAVCRRCPVMETCAQWALETRQAYGIWGGVTESERRAVLRRRGVRLATDGPAETPQATQPARPSTLGELFEQRTRRHDGGHIDWTACTSVAFKGANYTPRQIAFELDRGYKPTGTIKTTCGHKGCVQALHLTDAEERGRCGTQTGYRRHLARGESCEKCRAANAAADRRLRETGTTKALVR